LRQRGELESAAGELRKAIQLSPTDGPSLLNLAQILRQQGKTESAHEVMRKFGELRKDRETMKQAQVYDDTAIRLVERGDLNAGIGYFRAAVDLRPDFSEFHRNLAKALFQTRKLEEAGKEYETAIRLNPRDWQAHCGLGEVMAEQNHLADGIKEVESAVQLNPRYAEGYFLLNRLYQQVDDPRSAATALARARSLESQVNTRKPRAGVEAGVAPGQLRQP